jgi:hypothetical protein
MVQGFGFSMKIRGFTLWTWGLGLTYLHVSSVAASQLFVVNQKWDELETYLAEFLTKFQCEKFYPHPGIFCCLYQAQISAISLRKSSLWRHEQSSMTRLNLFLIMTKMTFTNHLT